MLTRQRNTNLMHVNVREHQKALSSFPKSTFHLPDDLVPYILEQLAPNFWDVATLARVSSYWYRLARRILYHSPNPLTYHSYYLLSRTLSDHPELGDLIRHLNLHPSSNMCSTEPRFECRNAAALNLAPLFRLPKLESISLKGDCAIIAEWYLTNLLYPQGIKEINIDGMQWAWFNADYTNLSACLRWTDTLAFRFVNLKRLRLANIILRVQKPRAFKPRPPRIEQLYLDRVQILEGVMSDLAPCAWDALQDLTIVVSDYSSAYDLQTVLLQAATSLISLKYLIKEPVPEHDLSLAIGDSELVSCTALKNLELSMCFPSSSLNTLGNSLINLESIVIYKNEEVSIDQWEKAILEGYFENLRELHLPVDDELRNLAEWQWPNSYSRVREVCKNRSIVLYFAYLL